MLSRDQQLSAQWQKLLSQELQFEFKIRWLCQNWAGKDEAERVERKYTEVLWYPVTRHHYSLTRLYRQSKQAIEEERQPVHKEKERGCEEWQRGDPTQRRRHGSMRWRPWGHRSSNSTIVVAAKTCRNSIRSSIAEQH